MYEKALVAVDGSRPSLKAVETAGELTKKGCLQSITLIYVVHIPHVASSADGMVLDFVPAEYQKELMREARRVIKAAKELLPPDCTIKTIIESGTPAETILHLVEKEHYDHSSPSCNNADGTSRPMSLEPCGASSSDGTASPAAMRQPPIAAP